MRCVIVCSVLYDSGDVSSLVTQLRKGMVEICILNLLNKGESYGYEIVQTLSRHKRRLLGAPHSDVLQRKEEKI